MPGLAPYYFKQAPNPENDSREDIVKVIIDWKKIHFTDLEKNAKSVAGFSAYRQF